MSRYQINYSSMLKIQGILSNYVQVTRIHMHACMTRELRLYIIYAVFLNRKYVESKSNRVTFERILHSPVI